MDEPQARIDLLGAEDAREGRLHHRASRQRAAGRPERTEYVLTAEGDKEFSHLLRTAWWTVDGGTEPLIPALTLLPFMDRDELIAALQVASRPLSGQLQELKFVRATINDGATGADGDIPEHVREIIDFAAARPKGELEWSRGFLRRLRDGAYDLAGEDARHLLRKIHVEYSQT